MAKADWRVLPVVVALVVMAVAGPVFGRQLKSHRPAPLITVETNVTSNDNFKTAYLHWAIPAVKSVAGMSLSCEAKLAGRTMPFFSGKMGSGYGKMQMGRLLIPEDVLKRDPRLGIAARSDDLPPEWFKRELLKDAISCRAQDLNDIKYLSRSHSAGGLLGFDLVDDEGKKAQTIEFLGDSVAKPQTLKLRVYGRNFSEAFAAYLRCAIYAESGLHEVIEVQIPKDAPSMPHEMDVRPMTRIPALKGVVCLLTRKDWAIPM